MRVSPGDGMGWDGMVCCAVIAYRLYGMVCVGMRENGGVVWFGLVTEYVWDSGCMGRVCVRAGDVGMARHGIV